MSSLKWIAAERNAYSWVQLADERYVAARFLCWKGFVWDFGLLGAHAIELYLKAYLIHKTGKYPKGHDLKKIYQECMRHDEFFKDESLDRYFLSEREALWPYYSDVFRYPEALPGERRARAAGMVSGIGGTHATLDSIAHFVREAVPRPQGHVDIVGDLINSDRSVWSGFVRATVPANSGGTEMGIAEIRRLFLFDNEHFHSA